MCYCYSLGAGCFIHLLETSFIPTWRWLLLVSPPSIQLCLFTSPERMNEAFVYFWVPRQCNGESTHLPPKWPWFDYQTWLKFYWCELNIFGWTLIAFKSDYYLLRDFYKVSYQPHYPWKKAWSILWFHLTSWQPCWWKEQWQKVFWEFG